MAKKVLGKMESQKGFIQIPTQSRNELVGDTPIPCKTLLNGEAARIDKYGRLWSPSLKSKFPSSSQVELIKTEGGFHLELVKSIHEDAVSIIGHERKKKNDNQVRETGEVNKTRKGTRMSRFGVSKREGHDSTPFYSSRLYQGLKTEEEKAEVENYIPPEVVDKVLCQDARRMDNIPDSSAHLMLTSPPYNVGKEYDEDLDLKEYFGLLKDVFAETYRVLVVGGRACVNIANVGRKPYIPYHKFIIDAMLEVGFLMRGEIIWNKGAGAGVSTAWGSWRLPTNPTLRDTHEYILVFSKGKFMRNGKNKEATITRDEFLEFTKSVWEFPPESAQRVGHPAPFPVELPYRCIQLYTFKDDVILDPFCGVGATCMAALKTGRHFIGIDINLEYVEKARKRIDEYLAQTKLSSFAQSS